MIVLSVTAVSGIDPLTVLLCVSGPKVPGQGDFSSMDIASVGDVSDSHNMDSEDLVPSLQVHCSFYLVVVGEEGGEEVKVGWVT